MEWHIDMTLMNEDMDLRIQCTKTAMINIMMMTITVRRSNGRDRQKTQRIGRNRQIGRKTVMNQTDMHINMILTSERTEEHTDMIRMSEHMDVRTRWTKKGNWKKSDYSEPSKTWKKDDGKSGSKYQPKKKYPSKDDHETVDYDFKDDDGNYGTAYSSQLGGGVGA